METRMERYRKYRYEIRHMADDAFPQSNAGSGGLNGQNPGDVLRKDLSSSDLKSPYPLYRKRILKRYLILSIAFLVTLIVFLVWFFAMQSRSSL